MRKILVKAEDTETGEVSDQWCRDTVDFGATFKVKGRTYKRILTAPNARVTNNYFKSYRLPFEEHVEAGGFTRAPHYVDGVAAFATRRERQEYEAAHNDNPANGDRIEWDQ